MEIETHRTADLLAVSVAGEMDADNCDDLKTTVVPLLTDDVRRLEIRGDGLGFIDSSGISALLELHRQMTDRGGSFAVVDATAPVRRVLEITGLAEAFEL